MPVPRKLASTFAPALRARGDEYVREGRVTLLETSPSLVRSTVMGEERYDVELRALGADRLSMICSCPYAEDHGTCKHIWATLVVADRQGAIPSVPDEAFLEEGRKAREADDEARRKELARLEEQRAREIPQYAASELPAIPTPPPAPSAPPPPPDPRPWIRQLRAVGVTMAAEERHRRVANSFPDDRRIIYILDVALTVQRDDGIVIELGMEALQKKGSWGVTRQFRLTRQQWLSAPEPVDRELAQMLLGTPAEFGHFTPGSGTRRYVVPTEAYDLTIRRMCESGRCRLRVTGLRGGVQVTPLAWDDGGPWSLRLAVTPSDVEHGDEPGWRVAGFLERDGERMELAEAVLLTASGILVGRGRAGRVIDHGAFALVHALSAGALERVPRDEALDLLGELYALPHLPPVELPAELEAATLDAAPTPCLTLRAVPATPWSVARTDASLAFEYAGTRVPSGAPGANLVLGESQRVVRRNRPAEEAALRRLERTGFRWEFDYARGYPVLRIGESRATDAAAELARDGWRVDFDGSALRTAGQLHVAVHSGIDWFDLDASVDFGDGVSARLPELLAALKRGDRTVKLSDQSLGLLDEEWLDRTGILAAAGQAVEGKLRFTSRQLGVLDVLLSALPPADADAAFEHARRQLHGFEGIKAADAPAGFTGTLREYQREGLGWLHFLRRFGFGGCLADDMGLGKTVQVLALLEARREEEAGTSIVVVPRSLVFNWEQEAARFTPQLELLVHRGPDRTRDVKLLADHDLIITTYGTLRRDITMLREMEFDYAILDEAQAIKNAGTASAKAARLIRARHRIAMTGTPVENNLRELWSLLEFLNPGLLGKASVFSQLVRRLDGIADEPIPLVPNAAAEELPQNGAGQPSGADEAEGEDEEVFVAEPEPNGDSPEETRVLLARAVRPYILRRTKAQVTPELPERLEQTVFVDLSAKERALYDELRDHYRNSLLGRIAGKSLGRERMHVLEALLRLRQAACHPGLIDPARREEHGSKVELLLSRVAEAIAEDHKVLVFSQFTSLLAIVRQRFDHEKIAYAYLDGSTTDRQSVVQRFQEDPECRVFLVSLKAGGVGLNLTAAEYVYLLDPWWNPAVEAQAIDRAHRIGQTRRVFAQRLIARNTVEEKVLALQDRKRDLADAIIRADDSVVASLGREELELLLS